MSEFWEWNVLKLLKVILLDLGKGIKFGKNSLHEIRNLSALSKLSKRERKWRYKNKAVLEMCKMVKYLGSKSVAERESSVSGGSGKSNERAKLLLLSPPLPQHPEKNFRSVSSLPVSHFQDSQKIDLLTPSFNFPKKVQFFFRVKELCFVEKIIRNAILYVW